jgi:hypothetical protein
MSLLIFENIQWNNTSSDRLKTLIFKLKSQTFLTCDYLK